MKVPLLFLGILNNETMYLINLLSIPKIEIKHKVDVDNDNFVHFQYIDCTNFKI
jgi:hypothetical protein